MSTNTRDGDYGAAETAGRDEKLRPNCRGSNDITSAGPRKANAITSQKKKRILLSLIAVTIVSLSKLYYITVTRVRRTQSVPTCKNRLSVKIIEKTNLNRRISLTKYCYGYLFITICFEIPCFYTIVPISDILTVNKIFTHVIITYSDIRAKTRD